MTLFLIIIISKVDILWVKVYGGYDCDYGMVVEETNEPGYICVGGTESFDNGLSDVYLIKTDAKGEILWAKTYGGEANDYGRYVAVPKEGGYIIPGETYSFGAGLSDVYVIKTDVNGNVLWTKTYGGKNIHAGYAIEQTKDGSYIIAGYTLSFGKGLSDVYLIRIDANGNILWTNTYGGSNYDYGWSVV